MEVFSDIDAYHDFQNPDFFIIELFLKELWICLGFS